MKQISKWIALMLLCTLGLSSCNKFLDITPTGKVIPSTLAEYRALMSEAYSQSLYDRGLTEYRTEAGVVNDSEYDRNSFQDISIWLDASPNAATQPFGWQDYYSAIYIANAIIQAREEMTDGSASEIDQLVGEAYLMRALLHFNLVNLYGQPYTLPNAQASRAIPLKLDLDLESVSLRNTLDEVYTSILTDIAEARKLISRPRWEGQEAYRFSTASIPALEARVRLYMGQWQEALERSEELLALHSTLVDLNEENSLLPNHYQSAEQITPWEQIYSTQVRNGLRASQSWVESHDAQDLRRSRYYGAFNTSKGYYPIDKHDGTQKYRCSFRTGEYYLTSAEASARLGDLASARTRLLALLAKRYTPVGYASLQTAIAGMTQEELLGEILKERSRELAFEGHYWFDLRRTTRPSISKTTANGTYTLEQGDARYTLRIPATAIASNPRLQEN